MQNQVIVERNLLAFDNKPILVGDSEGIGHVASPDIQSLRGVVPGMQANSDADNARPALGSLLGVIEEAGRDEASTEVGQDV